MNREECVLSAFAAGERSQLSPVQVQKLFFLLDKQFAGPIGGPHFAFTPYDYGPFDPNVYGAIEGLSRQGLVEIQNRGTQHRRFVLTEKGLQLGKSYLDTLPKPARDYLYELNSWVRRLNFRQLVSAIYLAYPDMKVNSVFREAST